jgi:ubiquinone/menaquinone biosynthesis C-methylase UbiE
MVAAVRAIRAMDRHGGFSVRRGQRAYAAVAPRLAGPLHRRILADAVAWAADRPALVVVDLGSGPGMLTADLGRRLPSATVIGVEPNDQMLEIARAAPAVANVRFAQGSAEHLPIPDASVDLVISSLSAHHWDDLAAAVGEIGRVLRADGRAWIYDLRFATFTECELAAVRGRLALTEESLRRSIPPGQGRLALFAVIGLTR